MTFLGLLQMKTVFAVLKKFLHVNELLNEFLQSEIVQKSLPVQNTTSIIAAADE